MVWPFLEEVFFYYEILKKKISKKSILYLIIEIGLVGIMLFIGALIEWNMIDTYAKKGILIFYIIVIKCHSV